MKRFDYIRKLFHKLPEPDFFEYFMVFLATTGILAMDRFTAIHLNNSYLLLFLQLISSSLLIFWIAWILFGYKAVRARRYIFIGVLILCVSNMVFTGN